MPHARTARAIATATVLREALVEALGGERVDGTELGPLYPEPWFDNLRYSLHGEGVDTSDAVTARLAWRGETSRTGCASTTASTATTATPRPPATRSSTGCTTRRSTSSHRTWPRTGCGGASPRSARDRPEQLVVLAATHSAPMRAFVATALGADPGEPDNLEDIRVRVRPDDTATITFRDHEISDPDPAAPAALDRPRLVRVLRP